MNSNPNKSVEKYIEQGEMMMKADREALDKGEKHALVTTMRGVLHTRLSNLKVKSKKLDEVNEELARLVNGKKPILEKARGVLQSVRVYVENAYFFDADDILQKLHMAKKPPLDEIGLLEYTREVAKALTEVKLPTPMPEEFRKPVLDVMKPLYDVVVEAERLRQKKAKAVEDRTKALDEFRDVLLPVRKWLWKMLPGGRQDMKLYEYGFKPYGK